MDMAGEGKRHGHGGIDAATDKEGGRHTQGHRWGAETHPRTQSKEGNRHMHGHGVGERHTCKNRSAQH